MPQKLRRAAVVVLAVSLAVAAAALAATPKSGQYQGKVAAGWGGPQIQFTVKGGKVQDVLARMFTRCNNGPQEQTIATPLKKFKVSKSGKFGGKSVDVFADGVEKDTVWIKGKFVSAKKATGTIRLQAISDNTCDTLERKFSVTLQK
jgi:hypothetical protein